MGTRWIQVPEAAERLGITEEMVRKHIRSGNLYAKRSGRGNRSAWLLDADEIAREAVIRGHRETPNRIDVKQAAGLLGTSEQIVRRFIREGRFLSAERSTGPGRAIWLIDADEINREAELKARRTTPSPPARMTVQEAAAALGTSPEMIRRWIRQGRLHAERSERGERSAWRVDADDIGREAERKAHRQRLHTTRQSSMSGHLDPSPCAPACVCPTSRTHTLTRQDTTPHWTVAWRNTDGGWIPASHNATEDAANEHRDQLLADGYTTLVVPPPDQQKTPDTASDQ